MLTEGRWMPVREAANECRIAERTLYARAKSKALASRKIRGVLHVDLAEVQQSVANRVAAPSGSGAERGAFRPDDPPGIQSAKERLLAKSLEAEELRVSVAAHKTREEIAAGEAEQERRRTLLQIEVEARRLEFEQLREQIRKDRVQREEQVAADKRAQDAEADKIRRRREQEQEARQREAARRTWAAKWVSTVAGWMRDQLGVPALVPGAISLANDVLSQCSPDEADDVVVSLLRAAFDREFAPTIEKHERAALQESRMLAAQRAAADLAKRWGPAVYERILRAALDAADRVDPRTGTGQQWVLDAAQRELDAWRAQRALEEHAARERREREHEEADRQRQRLREEEHVARQIQADERKREELDREWTRVAHSLADIASRELPRGANQSEQVAAVEILGAVLENRDESMQPAEFVRTARVALRALGSRVEARLVDDETCRKWAAFVEEALVDLRCQIRTEATDGERLGAEDSLRRELELARKDGASSVSFSACTDLTNQAAAPVWQRLAIEHAMRDVKEGMPDEVVMKAYRAAAREAQSERQRHTIQRVADFAASQVLQQYQLAKTLREIRSAGIR